MMWDCGKNLIQGLWNGIKSAKDWVLDKIAGIGNSIMKKIKGIFGIHSPSTEFAWVGKMNMLGLEKGMEDMKGQVNSTVGGMFDDMFSLSPSLYGSSSTNLSPQINVVVNNNMEQDPLGHITVHIADTGIIRSIEITLSCRSRTVFRTIQRDVQITCRSIGRQLITAFRF